MSEVKSGMKGEIESHSAEDSSEQVKGEIVKSKCANSITLKANQNTKQKETNINEVIESTVVQNGMQVEESKSKVDGSSELEKLSSLSSPEVSEFSLSSIESFEEMENDTAYADNELTDQKYQDCGKGFYIKDAYNGKRSYKKSVRRCESPRFERKNSRSSWVTDITKKHNERTRTRDDNYPRYSPDKDRSRYSSNRYRYKSWERSRNRYTSSTQGHNRSWDRNERYVKSRSPPYRARRSRRHSRSNSNSSPKRTSYKRGTPTKRRRVSSDSPPRRVGKLLDRRKISDSCVFNTQRAKSPSTKPPPLPTSPPPQKPPPPVENNSAIPRPPLTDNNTVSAGIFSQAWRYRGNQIHYNFPNPSMPNVSTNNLPLVPGLGNLPVHITANGQQILHDMDGRPIPVGLNGRLLPVDMSGRLFPHFVFPFSNQSVPIYMTEDGVLRLPNGEPVPYGPPNQPPVNIDGSIIPIGMDSRPLYPCPNVPRQNPFISSQVENPAVESTEIQQQVQKNPPALGIRQMSANANVKQRIIRTKLPPTIIKIETVSDLKLKESQISPKLNEIDTKTHLDKNKSTDDVHKTQANIIPESAAKVSKVNSKVKSRKPYEDVDLLELVAKFSERLSKLGIGAIYHKKVQRSIKEGMKPDEGEESLNVSGVNKKSGTAVSSDANLEKEPVCVARVSGEKNFSARSEKKSSGSKKVLDDEEALLEKKFIEAVQEAISLVAGINFNPPTFGRFLFSKSSTNFIHQSPPNESPLLRNTIRLPFLSPENIISESKKKNMSVNFRFLPQKNDGEDGRLSRNVPPANLCFAVQCDFTSKIIQNLQIKIEKLKRELFRYKNENSELTDLYKSVREENKEKTEELSKVMKEIEEKNKIIRDLRQTRK